MPVTSTIGALSSRGFGEFRTMGSAFTTYWASTVHNSNVYIARGNTLSTLLANLHISSNYTPFTPPSPNLTASASAQRRGMLLATGNVVWSDLAYTTTNGGTSAWTATSHISNDMNPSDRLVLGQNGAFAYKPSTNVLSYYTTYFDSKTNQVQSYAVFVNASTRAYISVSFPLLGVGSSNSSQQLIYAPSQDRFYLFMNGANQGSTTVGIYTSAPTSVTVNVPVDCFRFGAGVSANGQVLLFHNDTGTNRRLREYTDVNLTTFTDHGNVTGLPGTGNPYSNIQYLPVNNKYGMTWRIAGDLRFFYSSVSNPAAFTSVSFSASVPGASITSILSSSIFEDINGDIYITYLVRLQSKILETWSLTYRSTDGGASFTNIGYSGVYGAMSIFKNLQ